MDLPFNRKNLTAAKQDDQSQCWKPKEFKKVLPLILEFRKELIHLVIVTKK